MKFRLSLRDTPFNLEHSLECGQVHLWNPQGGWWLGVVGSHALRMQQRDNELIGEVFPAAQDLDFLRRYFRLDDDLDTILSDLSGDDTMRRAISRLYGLRIIRQDPWECLITYICATFKNIKAIRAMLRNLCGALGAEITAGDRVLHTFPSAGALAKADDELLRSCGLGYRTGYVVQAARRHLDRQIDFDALKRLTYEEAKRALLSSDERGKVLPGVGPKVADCLLLFALEKLEALPVDIWILRAVAQHYQHLFEPGFRRRLTHRLGDHRSLTSFEYEKIAETMRRYFGRYAGYAQEYLYHYIRTASP